MPNSNQLYEDMKKLNTLFEELCWGHDDDLEFSIEYLRKGGRVVIRNKTLDDKVS